jgi:hypothetical protein
MRSSPGFRWFAGAPVVRPRADRGLTATGVDGRALATRLFQQPSVRRSLPSRHLLLPPTNAIGSAQLLTALTPEQLSHWRWACHLVIAGASVRNGPRRVTTPSLLAVTHSHSTAVGISSSYSRGCEPAWPPSTDAEHAHSAIGRFDADVLACVIGESVSPCFGAWPPAHRASSRKCGVDDCRLPIAMRQSAGDGPASSRCA